MAGVQTCAVFRSPFESMFAVLDHVKTLVFAISDGALPSNVGGGYNLRVLLRRSLSKIHSQKWNVELGEIAEIGRASCRARV